MKLTQERIEEVNAACEQWSDEKIENLSGRLLDLCAHAIKTNTPNLINESDAQDMILLVDAFRARLQLQSEDSEGDIYIETGITPAPESDVTSEDKDALLEFADKLKHKAEEMPVTATVNPETQEEAPLNTNTESTGAPQSTSPEPTETDSSSAVTGKKPKAATSKKAGK